MDLTRTQRSLALRTVTTLSGSMRAADGSERPVTLRVQEGSGERLRVRRTVSLVGEGPTASEMLIEDRG
ncbi:MAG: hypothetical protein RIT28_3436 [Pseudomonadota bacterium]|jgi:hypothetical protein